VIHKSRYLLRAATIAPTGLGLCYLQLKETNRPLYA
jgi:hypothetical protein